MLIEHNGIRIDMLTIKSIALNLHVFKIVAVVVEGKRKKLIIIDLCIVCENCSKTCALSFVRLLKTKDNEKMCLINFSFNLVNFLFALHFHLIIQ